MTVLCSHQVVLLPRVVVRGQSDAGIGDTRLLRQANLRTKSSRKLRIPTLQENFICESNDGKFIPT